MVKNTGKKNLFFFLEIWHMEGFITQHILFQVVPLSKDDASQKKNIVWLAVS